MLKKILLIVLALVAVLLFTIAMQPAEYRVVRSAKINAPPSVVFTQVNDFHNWEAWSPWEKLDPAMKRTFDGSPSGVGAKYAWVGNSDVGEGKMTIEESQPSEKIRIKLEFIKPFAATNSTVFNFKGEGDQTNVEWVMDGTNNFMSKAFGLFMNMDKLVGGDFEKGLGQLKTVAEAKK